MLKNVLRTTVWVLLFLVLPVLPRPETFHRWPFWVAVFLMYALSLSQPSFDTQDIAQKSKDDDRSLLAIFVIGVLGFVVPLLDFAYGRGSDPACACDLMSAIGAALAVGALTFRVWSIRVLGKFFTAKVVIQDDHRVIDHGPYRLVRHPSYLGSWLMFIGIAVMLRSHVGVALSLVGFFFVYRYRIRVEEDALVGKLGAAYEAYRARTKKIVPFVY